MHQLDRLIKISEVRAMVNKSTAAIYKDMGADRFPRPKRIGRRAVAWKLSDIQNWMDNLEEAEITTGAQ